MTPDTGSAKSAWRRDLLAARRARSSAERAAADSTLITTLVGTCRDRAARTVAAYCPLLTEPGGPLLLPALAGFAAEVLLPVLLPDRDLGWERWGGGGHPSGVGSADLVVVPALAVDHRGVRLGRGGGSYDRALTRVAPGVLVVALLFDGELVPELPAEAHDQRVGAVITPTGGLRHVG